MKKFLKVLFYVIAAVYPFLVFTFLVILKLPTRILSLCIIALAAAFFLSATGTKKAGSKETKNALDWKPLVSSALFLAAGIFCFITGKEVFLKLYSVVISATLLFVFGSTLFFKPNLIFRLATFLFLQDMPPFHCPWRERNIVQKDHIHDFFRHRKPLQTYGHNHKL